MSEGRQVTLRALIAASLLCIGVLTGGSAAAQEGSALVDVLSFQTGATIYVDDVPVATTPLIEPLELPPGVHVIRVERRGFLPYEEEIELSEWDEVVIEADLLPFAGIVRVVTSAGTAEVYVDDVRVGTTPYEGEVPVGTHRFRVVREQYEEWRSTETIAAGEEYLIEATLVALPDGGTEVIVTETTPIYREWWFWSGAAVLIGGGIAAGVLLSQDDEAAPVDILVPLP